MEERYKYSRKEKNGKSFLKIVDSHDKNRLVERYVFNYGDDNSWNETFSFLKYSMALNTDYRDYMNNILEWKPETSTGL